MVDYRHKNVTRLNIPPAGLEARGEIVREKRIKYAYNPHLAPALRFDGTGKGRRHFRTHRAAGKRKLEPEEMKLLQEAFRNHEPWLEWAGKREQQWCVADPVALHIHERISTQAILQGRPAGGHPARPLRRPGAGIPRGGPVLQAPDGLDEPHDPGRFPLPSWRRLPGARRWPARCR